VFPNIGGVCAALGAVEAFGRLAPGVREKTSPATLFQMFLLFEHQVATLDRRSFGRIGAEGLHFLRISIATGMEDLKRAMDRIAAAAKDRDRFAAFVKEGKHLF
jgi:aspartate/methionine/tyrosine aminotransferase